MSSHLGRAFPAKILLFGEYTVINGSEALALPLRTLSGRWSLKDSGLHDWNPLLRFLQARPHLIDLARLERDLGEGQGFVSSIPPGKGLGSSGALVAALFERYGHDRSTDLMNVKAQLAELEGHYHGQSSGVDPLVSWVDQPLVLKGAELPRPSELPVRDWTDLHRFFLLDSSVARHSAPLIAVFRQKCQMADFQKILGELENLVSECIHDYAHLDEAHLGLHMEELSRLQLSAFSEMIPQKLRQQWEEGLNSRQYALKLCGAGGGGFFIGYRLRGDLPAGVMPF